MSSSSLYPSGSSSYDTSSSEDEGGSESVSSPESIDGSVGDTESDSAGSEHVCG